MCYAVPLAAAITTSLVWRKKRVLRLWWLNLLLYGGSLFGIIDHLWNKELFLVSRNWLGDLFLGVVITAILILAWGLILLISKSNPSLASYLKLREDFS